MDSLQAKTKQEEHNSIKTLAKPIEPTELAGFFLKIKEDHLQDRLIMNMEAWQDQEETKGSLPINIRQNRRLILCIQTTEQAEYQSAWQPTLRVMKSLAWCMYERGN